MVKKIQATSTGITAFVFSILFISVVSAFTVNPEIPGNISLNCGEEYIESFTISEGGLQTSQGVIQGGGYYMSVSGVSSANQFTVAFFKYGSCDYGEHDFSFSINDTEYEIELTVSEGLFDLGTVYLKEDYILDIGGEFTFYLYDLDSDEIYYEIECIDEEDSSTGSLEEGEYMEEECNGESFGFYLVESFSSDSKAELVVYSSEEGYAISKEKYDSSEDECVLGLDTLGAKVKRGNLFAIKTIDVNTNKAVPKVSVTILDQTGDLAPINGESSNTGFFSERLHSDYQEDLVVQLEKENCEPSTQVILFELSYNDYLAELEDEENSKTLKLVLSDSYDVGREETGTVTNLLDEAIEGATVKITKPDSTTFEVETDSEGVFIFTPEDNGAWKFQATKETFDMSELIEIEIQSDKFAIVSLVDGEEKSKFKKGDVIVFEVRDDNDDILPLTFEATIGDDTISFLDGVSEDFIFREEVRLEIPAVGGFEETSLRVRAEESKLSKYIYYAFVVFGIIILIWVIVKVSKRKSKSSSRQTPMTYQLGGEPR